MVEHLASNQTTRVRFPLAAPRHVEFKTVSCKGKKSPCNYGYTIIPVYKITEYDERHKNNIEWIEETLTDTWTWFVFAGYPEPGISYCFKSTIDAGIFILFKGGTVVHNAKK